MIFFFFQFPRTLIIASSELKEPTKEKKRTKELTQVKVRMPAAVTLTCMLSMVVCLCIETRETHESLVKWMNLSTITLTPSSQWRENVEIESTTVPSDHSYSSSETAYWFEHTSTIASIIHQVVHRSHESNNRTSKSVNITLGNNTNTTLMYVQQSIEPTTLSPSSFILRNEKMFVVPTSSTVEEEKKVKDDKQVSLIQSRGKSPIISTLASVLALSYWQNQRKKCCISRLCPCRGQYSPSLMPPSTGFIPGEMNPSFIPMYPYYPSPGMYPGFNTFRPGQQPGQPNDGDSGGAGGGEEELLDGFQSSYHVVNRPTKRRRPTVTVSSPHLHHHYNHARPTVHLHPISMASFTSSATGHKFHPINGGLVKWSPEQAAAAAAAASVSASASIPSSQVVSLSPVSSSSSSAATATASFPSSNSLSSQLTALSSPSNAHSLQRSTNFTESFDKVASRENTLRLPFDSLTTRHTHLIQVNSRTRKHFINDTLQTSAQVKRDKRSHKQPEITDTTVSQDNFTRRSSEGTFLITDTNDNQSLDHTGKGTKNMFVKRRSTLLTSVNDTSETGGYFLVNTSPGNISMDKMFHNQSIRQNSRESYKKSFTNDLQLNKMVTSSLFIAHEPIDVDNISSATLLTPGVRGKKKNKVSRTTLTPRVHGKKNRQRDRKSYRMNRLSLNDYSREVK